MPRKIPTRLNKVLQVLDSDEITRVAYDSYRSHTPYRSGNARRNTKKEVRAINADYPYAQRLEDGYSKQAPDGMTIPTIDDIRKYISSKLGVKV